jgi:[histone H3]-lysine4 N-trimethyltransferase ATXR3
MDDGEQQPQIEERLTWGIDLFTRNIIYHCLPEIDIDGAKKTSNEARRNHFIEHSLAKAMNFMGAEGYNLLETCNYIKQHAELPFQLPVKKEEAEEGDQPPVKLFSERDYLYADLLARNYELAEDKTGFRVHTKGKGAICIEQKGIEQGSFIVEYFGEIYEPWRWYDR